MECDAGANNSESLQPDSEVLEASLQTILNVVRESDIQNAVSEKAGKNNSQNSFLPPLSTEALRRQQQEQNSDLELENTELLQSETALSEKSSADGRKIVDLSKLGPLRLKMVKVVKSEKEDLEILMRVYGHSVDPHMPASQKTPRRWAMR